VIRFAAVGLEFLCLLALARILDAASYGTYAIAMTLVAIFAVPAALGFDRLVVRELAACQALADWEHAHGMLRRSAQLVLAAATAAAVATWIAGRLILQPTGEDASRALLLASLLVPLVALARLRQAALQGFGHVAAGLAPELIVQPAIVILLVAAVAATASVARDAALALGLQVIAAVSALLMGAWLLRRRIPSRLRDAAPRYRMRAWWRAGIAFMSLVMMTTILTQVDTILVGRLLGEAQAGKYKVASQLAMLVGLPLTAISVAMAPVIAGLYAAGRRNELRAKSIAAARVISGGAFAIALLIVLGGRWILSGFGPEFAHAYLPALVLSAAYLFHSAMATSGYLLIMSEHEKLVMAVFAAGAAMNVVAGLALIPRFGMLGAALSSSASLCLVSLSCALLARRMLGINGTIFARQCETMPA
jgi:O-antigen/teichoic acid export membrane protein